MFKLILHHVYRSSAPFIDISGHGNHAQGPNVGWNEDGAAQQSGAAVFNGASSRSLVPLNPVWQDLTALRVETLLRFEPVQGTPGKPARLRRHLVVEGPLSFAVFIGKEKNAVGMVMGLLKDPDADDDLSANDTLTATLTSGGSVDPFTTLVADLPQPLPIPPGYKLDWVPVASTPEFAPDGQNRTIEPGEWTRIEFAHTGTSLWLYLDGVLAGVRHDIISPVLPVQGTGVHIGWAPGAFPDTLRGRLDELRIWKYDPYCHTKKFFCRPMPPETESCWRLLLGRLQALATEPETGTQLTAVLKCLDAALISLLRALLQRGQPAMDEARRFARRYDDLWCRGAIQGAAMRTLTGEFMSWLEQTAGDSWSEYLSQALKCITKLKGLNLGPKIGDLGSCDPAFIQFLAGINRQVASDLISCFARSDTSTRERDLYKPISNDAEVQTPAKVRTTRAYARDPDRGD